MTIKHGVIPTGAALQAKGGISRANELFPRYRFFFALLDFFLST